MTISNKTLLIIRATRIIVVMMLFCIFCRLLYLCCQIPCVEQELNPKEKNDISLDGDNPNNLSTYFKWHDLSKTEYRFQFISPVQVSDENNRVSVYREPDFNQHGNGLNVVEISPVEGGLEASFGYFAFIIPMGQQMCFYTKNLVAENLQMIRSFFLTEIVLFLFALLCREFYKFVHGIFRNKSFFRCQLYGGKQTMMSMAICIFMSIVLASLLWLVNIVPVNEINQESFHETDKASFFAPYDISAAYQHICISSANRISNEIVWNAKEIVEIKPNDIIRKNDKIGAKSLYLKSYSKDEDIDLLFYTQYLQSTNYQEIRLLILTTLLLFFLERSVYYFRILKRR